MAKINAYLKFNGNCREAMTFYKECLGGELSLQAVEDTPAAEHMPAAAQKSILHATLIKGDLALLGSDMVGSEGLTRGSNIFLVLECTSEAEINTFFAKLASGGQITSPLKPEFWGGIFGQLTDKYGVSWMLDYEQKKE